ncbi:Protein of unknown function [Maribacter ulvicola]|uniref:Uncharacterized protein n=1 Tax=Maribacter ulvicola TaxID=228959 RepID=A0A1N6YUD7_9FLAO|nr:Protein of unknown function [Maribacter ulvicola]
MTRMEINKIVYALISTASITLVMAILVSFVVMIVNMGFVYDFLIRGIKGVGVAFVVALPFSMITISLIEKRLNKLVKIK